MSDGAPIPMVLFCPQCSQKHVDKPEPEVGWLNPPHRSHLCAACGWIWRPCDRPTAGVESIETSGSEDNTFRPKVEPGFYTVQMLAEEYCNGRFGEIPLRFLCNNVVVELFDGGEMQPGLYAVEIWHGERLGNACYVSSYPDDSKFYPVADEATTKLEEGDEPAE